MTRPDFDAQIVRLMVLRFSHYDVDEHFTALKDIPAEVFTAAVSHALKTRRDFPVPFELKADVDVCRRDVKTAHPFQAAECCNFTGWVEVAGEDGHTRAQRCPCYLAHRALLAELGVTVPAPVQAQRQPDAGFVDVRDYKFAQSGEPQ